MLGMTRHHLSSIHNYPVQMVSVRCLQLFRQDLTQGLVLCPPFAYMLQSCFVMFHSNAF